MCASAWGGDRVRAHWFKNPGYTLLLHSRVNCLDDLEESIELVGKEIITWEFTCNYFPPTNSIEFSKSCIPNMFQPCRDVRCNSGGASTPAVPFCSGVSARLKCVQEHSSPVNIHCS